MHDPLYTAVILVVVLSAAQMAQHVYKLAPMPCQGGGWTGMFLYACITSIFASSEPRPFLSTSSTEMYDNVAKLFCTPSFTLCPSGDAKFVCPLWCSHYCHPLSLVPSFTLQILCYHAWVFCSRHHVLHARSKAFSFPMETNSKTVLDAPEDICHEPFVWVLLEPPLPHLQPKRGLDCTCLCW